MFVGPGGLSYRSRSSSDVRSPQLHRRGAQQQQRLERQHQLITSPVKKARSYLTDEVRHQFEQAAATGQQGTPQKNSFVRRLVATLERRNSDEQIVPLNRPANNSSWKDLTLLGRPAERATTLDEAPKTPTIEQLDRTLVLSRLDEVSEREEDDFPYPEELADDSSPISAWSPSADDGGEALAKRPRGRGGRILRHVLSSIMRWKAHKSLPTGTRDEYYSARPSLGEEMRAFRHDTMPQLLERADAQATPPMLIEQQRQREFDQMIASPRLADEPTSTATIRPVYGNKQHARLSWQLEDDLLGEQSFVEQHQPIQCYSSSLPSRPYLPQRSSREDSDVFAGVQLRNKPFAANGTPNNNNNNNNNNSSKNKNTSSEPYVVYDVPRCLDSTPIYENVSAAINPGDDKRLQRTVFTTFRLS